MPKVFLDFWHFYLCYKNILGDQVSKLKKE